MASIRKRVLPSGRTTWLADFRDGAGRRRAKQFQTRRQAEVFLTRTRHRVLQGDYVHEADSITVAEAAARWLGRCKARQEAGRRMERATYQDYEAKVRLHLLDPELGLAGLKLCRLTRGRVAELRDGLLASGRSETMVRRVLACLSLILAQAQEDGLIAANPARGVRVIRASRQGAQIEVPSKETVRRLVEAAPASFRPLLLVAALCGLRASEARALRWQDVDFSEGLIHVRQRADAFKVIGEPKSAAGFRSVPMGPLVARSLREWCLACPNGALGLVFPNKMGEVRAHTTVLKRHFKPLCRTVGVSLRWHDLRHFAVSLWIEQGFSVKAVMTFAGHASVQMTLERYGHLFPSPDHQKNMAAIETRLFS